MDIIKEVLRLHPDDISAIARLNGMLVKPADRYANMRRLLGVASQPILQYELGETILQNDLMAARILRYERFCRTDGAPEG